MFKATRLRATIYISSFMFLFSCTWGEQLSALSAQYPSMQNRISALSEQYQSMQDQINNMHVTQEKLIIEQRCKNPKVLRLITECKELAGGETVCVQAKNSDAEDLIRFMSTEKHVLVRLFPSHGFGKIANERIVQLARLLNPENMLSVSKVLIIVQLDPDENSHLGRSVLAARDLKKYIINTLQIDARAVYGPLTIPCNAATNMLDKYSKEVPNDRPLPTEPSGKTPSIGVWIFRLDCGGH